MPAIHELQQIPLQELFLSLGGSVFRPSRVNQEFTREFISFCREQLKEGHLVLAVLGGGGIARDAIADARALGVHHEKSLDSIGISVTRDNAHLLEKIFQAHGINAHLYKTGDILLKGNAYLRGGTEPGHTTDFVTVQVAIDAEIKIVLNLGDKGGIYLRENGTIDESRFIQELTWDKYLEFFPGRHTPGENVPFDHEAALLAKQHGLTVVMLGPEVNNLNNFLKGNEFAGTIIHP